MPLPCGGSYLLVGSAGSGREAVANSGAGNIDLNLRDARARNLAGNWGGLGVVPVLEPVPGDGGLACWAPPSEPLEELDYAGPNFAEANQATTRASEITASLCGLRLWARQPPCGQIQSQRFSPSRWAHVKLSSTAAATRSTGQMGRRLKTVARKFSRGSSRPNLSVD